MRIITLFIAFTLLAQSSTEARSESSKRFQSEEVQSGWKSSPWFGYFYDPAGDWIYHTKLGWLYVGVSTNESNWIFSESMGWIWTSNKEYPFLWNDNGAEWLYFDTSQKTIYSYSREKWLAFDEYSSPQNANNLANVSLVESERKQQAEADRLAEIARQQAEADRLAEIARQQSNWVWNIPISRDPKWNTSINPKWNTSIDPKWNTSIDPKWNTSIDPKWNTSINPKWNTSIDPKWNTSVNPKWNTSINPEYNSRIDPRFNNWYGNFLFDEDEEFMGVIVRVNNSFRLLFSKSGQWIGYLVFNSESGFNLFDNDDIWRGYILSNGDGNWNLFNTEGEWKGFTT